MSEAHPSHDPPMPASGSDRNVDTARPELSIVLPVFNEESVIDELHRRLGEFLAAVGTTWEVIFVDDGSSDQSFAKLQALSHPERRYRVVSFARNFGHQLAITAGIDYARGLAVVVMDADLQDPPEIVSEMLARFREGFDIVHGVRRKRERESLFKRATAYIFYRLLRSLAGISVPVDAGDFRLMSRRVLSRSTASAVRAVPSGVTFAILAAEWPHSSRRHRASSMIARRTTTRCTQKASPPVASRRSTSRATN